MVGKLRGHTADIICMEFSPDGNLIATGSNDHDIFLWSSSKYSALFTLSSTIDLIDGPVLSAAQEAAVAAEMEAALSKEMELGEAQVGYRGGAGHDAPVVSVAFSGMHSGKAGQSSYKRCVFCRSRAQGGVHRPPTPLPTSALQCSALPPLHHVPTTHT